jgi:hypothetical protein
MGHAKVDTTLNVYTQVGSACGKSSFWENLARRTGRFPQLAHSRSGVNLERFAAISPKRGRSIRFWYNFYT